MLGDIWKNLVNPESPKQVFYFKPGLWQNHNFMLSICFKFLMYTEADKTVPLFQTSLLMSLWSRFYMQLLSLRFALPILHLKLDQLFDKQNDNHRQTEMLGGQTGKHMC